LWEEGKKAHVKKKQKGKEGLVTSSCEQGRRVLLSTRLRKQKGKKQKTESRREGRKQMQKAEGSRKEKRTGQAHLCRRLTD